MTDNHPACTVEEARALTERIKLGLEAIWDLIVQAHKLHAWDALGYHSWDDYCSTEFREARLKLPPEERHGTIRRLSEAGMSPRAISAATGLARNTIKSDLRQVGQTDPPEHPQPREVTGTDGKTYTIQPRPAVTQFVETDPDVQNARYIHEFYKALGRSDDFMEFDPHRLAELADNDLIRTIDDYVTRVQHFADRFAKGLPGVRIVHGGKQ